MSGRTITSPVAPPVAEAPELVTPRFNLNAIDLFPRGAAVPPVARDVSGRFPELGTMLALPEPAITPAPAHVRAQEKDRIHPFIESPLNDI